jgi:uncharacterized membrane protein
MTNTRLIARILCACTTSLAAIGLLISVIYFYSDYEMNSYVNVFLDDFNMPFIIVMIALFSLISFLLFFTSIKKLKKSKNVEK